MEDIKKYSDFEIIKEYFTNKDSNLLIGSEFDTLEREFLIILKRLAYRFASPEDLNNYISNEIDKIKK